MFKCVNCYEIWVKVKRDYWIGPLEGINVLERIDLVSAEDANKPHCHRLWSKWEMRKQ